VKPDQTSDQVKAVFFDAAGTLFQVRARWARSTGAWPSLMGCQATPEAIELAFQEQFANAPVLAFPNRTPEEVLAMERRWWEKLMRLVFQEIGMFPRFNDYFNNVYEAFKGTESWELYPETEEVLKRLKSEGRYVGVISNFDSRIHEVCRALNISAHLDSDHDFE
jgi:putative hydrolase of the HAD superfamily